MAKPQASFAKRQREQAKREKQQLKAARRAERKTTEKPGDDDMIVPDEVVEETSASE